MDELEVLSSWAMNPMLDHVPYHLQNADKSPFELTWPNSLQSPLSCLYLTITWPVLTSGTKDVDGWTNGTGTSSTYIPTCPCGSFCKIARGTLRSTKWLRDHQMAAESVDGCGMPVSMSKTKQNSHPLAKLTWLCLMTTNVMICMENEAKERGKWWKQ